jgi:glycosyltransferase involved in cell wall biosynthesis
MTKVNIALSVPYFFPYNFGGGQVYVYWLAKELSRRGHIVTIVTSAPWEKGNDEYILKNYEYDGLSVKSISLNPEVVTEGDKYSELSPVLVQGLRNILKKLNTDIVHINGFKTALITICNELNIPNVVTAHHPGFACPASTLLTPDDSLCEKAASISVCLPCCSKHKRPGKVGWLLGKIPFWIYRPTGRFLDKYKKVPYVVRGLMYPWWVEKRMEGQKVLLNNSQFIISPSKAMEDLLVRNGVSKEKIFLVPHGIEPLDRLPIEKIDNRRIRFGYIGSVGRAKGFHVLLEALEKLSRQEKCELHVFGEAQNPWDQEYMQRYLNIYKGKSEIITHGYLDHHKILDAFKQIDVLVVPSIYLEVFGLVVLEAFSAGRPVIVTKSGGPAELVRDGVDGFIVDRNDSKSLAEAMQKFIENPDLILEMSKRIPHVKTIQEYVDEIENLYFQMIDKYPKEAVSQ